MCKCDECTGSLSHDDENDYTLRDGETSCWITVDNISVYIVRTDEGVVVDLFPRYLEMECAIASTYAFFNEAQEAADDYEFETRNQRQGAPTACGLSDPGPGNQEASIEE